MLARYYGTRCGECDGKDITSSRISRSRDHREPSHKSRERSPNAKSFSETQAVTIKSRPRKRLSRWIELQKIRRRVCRRVLRDCRIFRGIAYVIQAVSNQDFVVLGLQALSSPAQRGLPANELKGSYERLAMSRTVRVVTALMSIDRTSPDRHLLNKSPQTEWVTHATTGYLLEQWSHTFAVGVVLTVCGVGQSPPPGAAEHPMIFSGHVRLQRGQRWTWIAHISSPRTRMRRKLYVPFSRWVGDLV